MDVKATAAAGEMRFGRADQKKKGKLRQYSGLLFGLFLLAAVIYISIHIGEGRQFVALVENARPGWLVAGLVYQAATYVASGAIWWIVVRRFNVDMSLAELSALSLAKLSLEKIIPAGGFGGSLLLIRSVEGRGAPESVAAATLLVDVLSIYAARAITIVASVAIIWMYQGMHWVIVLVCIVFVLFAAAILGGIYWLTGINARQIPKFIRKIPAIGPVMKSISEAPPEAMHSRSLFWEATGLQVLIIVLDALTLDAMLRSLGHVAPLDATFASFSMAGAASMLSLIPGGLGAFEGVSILMLGMLKVPIEAGLAATLMLRAFILWLPMIPGFFILKRESRHLVEEGEEEG
jgi:uncharacterized membrane protein YbhN (UPF0104 family)